jgi:hypothetical protein
MASNDMANEAAANNFCEATWASEVSQRHSENPQKSPRL